MARQASSSQFWPLARTYLSAATIVVFTGGIVAALALGVRPLETRAAAVIDRGPPTITIAWPVARPGEGTWLPLPIQEQLTVLATDAAGSSADCLSAEQLRRIALAMEQCGWYSQTPRVSRRANNEIVVDGSWRIPAANVVFKGGRYLISWDGKPMPPGVESTWTILEPAVGPPRDVAGDRDYSQAWAGEDMAASLELLAKVSGEAWSSQVRAIDASKYADGGGLMLVTDKDTRVVWGGRPSKPRLGEVTTAQKLEHIRQLVQDTKRIDAGYPLIYVNQERMQFDISASAQQQARADVEPDEPR